MGALISEHEAVAFLGLDRPFYEFCCAHKLPCVCIAGKLYLEVKDIPR